MPLLKRGNLTSREDSASMQNGKGDKEASAAAIATGTPSGIGPMQASDTVEIKIPPIGTLRNYVITR